MDNRTPLEAALTDLDGDCWVWRGVVASHGYAITRATGNKQYVHRLITNPAPGMEVHHTCMNRRCVNPAHLEVVTHEKHEELHLDLHPVCRNGHFYTEDNIYWTPDGKRQCRECKLTNNRKTAAKRRAHGRH